MPRRVVPEQQAIFQHVEVRKPFFDDSASPKKKAKKFNPKNSRAFTDAVANAREFMSTLAGKNWDGVTHETLLGLYAVLHERCYGFTPDDVCEEWAIVLRQLKGWLEKYSFSIERGVAFLRWYWSREIRLRNSNPERTRVQWRWVFNTQSALDYRAARGR